MFRFAGSRVAPAALFDASLLDFLKDRHDAVLFFVRRHSPPIFKHRECHLLTVNEPLISGPAGLVL